MKSVLDKLNDSSEKLGYFIGQNKIERLKEAVFNEAGLGKTGNVILDAIDINIPSDISRMAVIHSCTLEGQVNDILADMIDIMNKSGIADHLDRIIILNYGTRREMPVLQTDGEVVSTTLLDKTTLLHMHDTCQGFEIPTIKVLYDLSKTLNKDAQILYMHTKGVSYKIVPKSVTEYRRYMMYYLVEKHVACYHLLKSGMIDVLGLNLRINATIDVPYKNRGKFFEGNFWWANAGYLASLSSDYNFHNKYSAEYFVLSSLMPRIYQLDHGISDQVEYQRSLYDSPNQERNKCVNVNYCLPIH